jgi:hypothetical protein
MIVGHLAFACIAKRTFFKTQNYPLLILASYGPDVVDKTASVLFGYPGRNFGHSLLVFAAVFTCGWLLCQAFHLRHEVVFVGAVMWMSHLAGDFVRPTVMFWPLLSPITGDPFHLAAVLHRMYVEFRWPGQLALEICLVTLALVPMSVLDRVGALDLFRAFRREKSTES